MNKEFLKVQHETKLRDIGLTLQEWANCLIGRNEFNHRRKSGSRRLEVVDVQQFKDNSGFFLKKVPQKLRTVDDRKNFIFS